MNPTLAEEKAPAKNTPAWLKWTLLVLLFAASLTGLASGSRQLKKPACRASAPSGKPFNSGAMNFRGFSNFTGKTDFDRKKSSDGSITCQGTLIQENGKALAIINDRTVYAGNIIDGVKILEITRSHVLVEYRGKTRRLKPGDRFTPAKK